MSDALAAQASCVLELTALEVSSSYDRDLAVVSGVNWRVERNDFWLVGGLLGTGKSDFLSTIAGVLPFRSGQIHLAGQPLMLPSEEGYLQQRLKIGMVHDGGLLFSHLSVAENVALPLRYHHNLCSEDTDEKVHAWLQATGLEGFGSQSSTRISRNWAQRAGLARACILQPEILLLDTPLTGLDPLHTHWWIDFLDSLSRGHPLMNYRPMTLIVTCDQFEPWLATGRRFALLRQGRLEVLSASMNPTTLTQLLRALPA